MTIGNPYLHNPDHNSPTIVSTNSTPNSSFSQYNDNGSTPNGNHIHQHQHFDRNRTFGSPALSEIHIANREKFLRNQFQQSNNQQPTRSKRTNSECDENFKKVKQITDSYNNSFNKNIPVDQLTLDNINLDEFPKFNHPEGGIIQFTPIGNVRTFLSDNNVMQRVIEKNSSFDINKTDRGIDGYKLYLGNNIPVDSSPSNETETYMRFGYSSNENAACSCCHNFDYDCDSDLEDDDDYDMACDHHHHS